MQQSDKEQSTVIPANIAIIPVLSKSTDYQ